MENINKDMITDVVDNIPIERISTGITGAEVEDDIIITQSAIDRIYQTIDENRVPDDFRLRLGIRGGGCSGVNYIIGFDQNLNDNDIVIDEIKNITIVIDYKSLFYLMGVTIDFIDGPEGKGFVFNAPGDEKTCGCNS